MKVYYFNLENNKIVSRSKLKYSDAPSRDLRLI